ncbi:hypothetical protein [Ktedonobacter robiniae]|uniref:Uncharacterized protein n=1 Tax=Ktedonobacter robiniae TaxID=2778365 RepID=A0ABQ3V254_9CHLR|nr:hypothetical protein [Ktedonobacter robiniae]GHO59032.1 hypothetical protein KSB_75070 [Ktedonobacter robiniae]
MVYATFTGSWISLVTSTQWSLWIGGIGLLSLIVGVLLYFVGQFNAGRQETDDQEIIAEVTDSAK